MKHHPILSGLVVLIGLLGISDTAARSDRTSSATNPPTDHVSTNHPGLSMSDNEPPGVVVSTTWWDEQARGTPTRRLRVGVGSRVPGGQGSRAELTWSGLSAPRGRP